MKRVVLGCLLAVWAVSLASAGDVPDRASWSDSGNGQAVDLSRLVDLEGNAFDPLAQSPTIIVHFWATWCEPCLEEFPRLDRLVKRVSPAKITIVAVSEDRGGADDVRGFMSKHPGLTGLKLLVDPGRKSAKALGVSVLPTTIVIHQGKEQSRAVGSSLWEDDDLTHLSNYIGN